MPATRPLSGVRLSDTIHEALEAMRDARRAEYRAITKQSLVVACLEATLPRILAAQTVEELEPELWPVPPVMYDTQLRMVRLPHPVDAQLELARLHLEMLGNVSITKRALTEIIVARGLERIDHNPSLLQAAQRPVRRYRRGRRATKGDRTPANPPPDAPDPA